MKLKKKNPWTVGELAKNRGGWEQLENSYLTSGIKRNSRRRVGVLGNRY